MNSISSLVVAIVLGVIGAACNWLFIAKKSSQYEKQTFVVVSDNARINPGDRFSEEDLEPLDIPRPAVGNLKDVAVPWSLRTDIIGRIATKSYAGGELIIFDDLKTPGMREFAELLASDEVARSIAVDSRSFVPERVNPGNQVSFEVTAPSSSDRGARLETKTFGPFRVLALGVRTGSLATQQAAGKSSGSQHVVTIGVKFPHTKEVAELFDRINLAKGSSVRVLVHSEDFKDPANNPNPLELQR